eukprot:2418440-Amphidinium_carterae.1
MTAVAISQPTPTTGGSSDCQTYWQNSISSRNRADHNADKDNSTRQCRGNAATNAATAASRQYSTRCTCVDSHAIHRAHIARRFRSVPPWSAACCSGSETCEHNPQTVDCDYMDLVDNVEVSQAQS